MSMEGLSRNTRVQMPLEARNEQIVRSVETGTPLAVEGQPTTQDHEIALAGLDKLQAVAGNEAQIKNVVAKIIEEGGTALVLLALAVNAANTSGDVIDGTVGAYPKHMNEGMRQKFIEGFEKIGNKAINVGQLDSARVILRKWKANAEMVQEQNKSETLV